MSSESLRGMLSWGGPVATTLALVGAVVLILGMSARAPDREGSEERGTVEAQAPAVAEGRGGRGGGGRLGNARFRDTWVYADGVPIGALSFGELPVGLKPVWIKEKVSEPKEYGDFGPGWRWVQTRRYRLREYLRAAGVELSAIQQVHVHGPKASDVLVVDGAELRGARGAGLYFRFGAGTRGKAIPVVPPGLGNGKAPDKIVAVAVYLRRPPPQLVRNQGLFLDGQRVQGIPYHGEPMRGGVRVYLDNRLAGVIRRRELTPESARADGRWGLPEVLSAQGVPVDQAFEAWVVREDRRSERLSWEQLSNASFGAAPESGGGMLLEGDRRSVDAIALHTRRVRLEDLPAPTATEEL